MLGDHLAQKIQKRGQSYENMFRLQTSLEVIPLETLRDSVCNVIMYYHNIHLHVVAAHLNMHLPSTTEESALERFQALEKKLPSLEPSEREQRVKTILYVSQFIRALQATKVTLKQLSGSLGFPLRYLETIFHGSDNEYVLCTLIYNRRCKERLILDISLKWFPKELVKFIQGYL